MYVFSFCYLASYLILEKLAVAIYMSLQTSILASYLTAT